MQHGAKVYVHVVHGTKTIYANETAMDGAWALTKNTYYFRNYPTSAAWPSFQHADNLSEPPCITTMYDGTIIEVIECTDG